MNFDDIKEKAKTCRAMVLCDPHNPTGKVFDVQELERLCRICVDNDMYLMTDDI